MRTCSEDRIDPFTEDESDVTAKAGAVPLHARRCPGVFFACFVKVLSTQNQYVRSDTSDIMAAIDSRSKDVFS